MKKTSLHVLGCLLLFTAASSGLELDLNVNTPVSSGSRAACGVLHCLEAFQAPDESSPSLQNISSLNLYKKNGVSTGRKGSKTKDVLVASLTPQHPKISSVSNGIKIDGLLNTQWASLRLTLYEAEDCASEFVCQLHGTSSQGQLLVLTSRLVQGERKRQRDDQSMASDVTLQVLGLVQQLDTKVALVTRSADEVKDKIEDLEHRFEDKLESINENFIDRLASLENRIEDKIEHSVDDKLSDLLLKMFELTKNVDLHGKEIREVFKENLLTIGQELKLEQNEALANLSSISQNLQIGIQNITTSSLSLIASNLIQIQSAVENDKNTLEYLVEAVDEISQSSKNCSSATHSRYDAMERGLQLKFQRLTSAINSSSDEIVSSTYDLFQQQTSFNTSQLESVIESIFVPKVCSRGMNNIMIRNNPSTLTINPSKGSLLDVPYLCDTVTQGGGWIVFQRRVNGDVDFYRNWTEYRNGFGSLGGDFWLGNENIHAISNTGGCELRIELIYSGKRTYAQYSSFSVDGESNSYALHLSGYSGTSGDSLSYHNDQKFSTLDKDNDISSGTHCAEARHGAWWYKSCDYSNLNGLWGESSDRGVIWDAQSTGYSVSFSEMKVRC